MASTAQLEPSGRVRGVLVDGQEPFAFTATSGTVAVPGNLGRPLHAAAEYRDETITQPVVNPNVLRPGGVTVCAGTIYYDTAPPPWCESAPVESSTLCAAPYTWGCGTETITTNGLYTWAGGGFVLRTHRPPSATAYVITATAAMVALIVVDLVVTSTRYPWLAREVSLLTVSVAIMSGLNWTFVAVASVALGITLSGASPRLVGTALRPALVITVAECLTDYNIDATAVGISRVIAAVAVSVAAGARGSVWTLPWAVVRGVYPIVVTTYTLSPDSPIDEWLVASVIVALAFLIGFMASPAGAWRKYLGLPAAAPQPRGYDYVNPVFVPLVEPGE